MYASPRRNVAIRPSGYKKNVISRLTFQCVNFQKLKWLCTSASIYHGSHRNKKSWVYNRFNLKCINKNCESVPFCGIDFINTEILPDFIETLYILYHTIQRIMKIYTVRISGEGTFYKKTSSIQCRLFDIFYIFSEDLKRYKKIQRSHNTHWVKNTKQYLRIEMQLSVNNESK